MSDQPKPVAKKSGYSIITVLILVAIGYIAGVFNGVYRTCNTHFISFDDKAVCVAQSIIQPPPEKQGEPTKETVPPLF